MKRTSTRLSTERGAHTRAGKLVLAALLSALALAVNVAESAFPLPFPGMRLGLANVFSLAALLLLGPASAVLVSALRVLLSFLLSGNPFALACSAGGLLCSLPVSILLYEKFRSTFSVEAISVASAVSFNVGQLGVVVLLTGEPALFGYLPMLTAAAFATGYAVGAAARALVKRLTAERLTAKRLP